MEYNAPIYLQESSVMPDKRKQVYVQCRALVDRDAVKRETIDGVEHITISSFTLPDDIVMNGMLYPVDAVNASFHTLERTLAPVEHPTKPDGSFLPASDPLAINSFYAGAFNQNVRREGKRIAIDKVINVVEAGKSDRGKRLLDRINELETSANPRPIHTSTGLFLEIEELAEPQHNAEGVEFTSIAHDMVFDHDAILLDSVAAASPEQGVGMAVNSQGQSVEVVRVALNQDLVTIAVDDVDDLSHDRLRELLFEAVNTPPLVADWITEVFNDKVIYTRGDVFFSVPYTVGNGVVTITGLPMPVNRDVSFIPKTNQEDRDMAATMTEVCVNALKDKKITTEGLDANALLAKYVEVFGKPPVDDTTVANADDVEADTLLANTLKAINDRLKGLEDGLQANANDELKELAEIVGNSDKYPAVDVKAATDMGVTTLRLLAGNCGVSHGIPLTHNSGGTNTATAYEMPK